MPNHRHRTNRAAGSATYLKVNVLGFQLKECRFKITSNMELRKLKLAYSDQCGVHPDYLVFYFASHQIQDEDTAKQLGIEHDNTITAYEIGLGGSHSVHIPKTNDDCPTGRSLA